MESLISRLERRTETRGRKLIVQTTTMTQTAIESL